MAATISINFTTPEEVFSNNPPSKKSVSAKVLNEVLGGGVVGGGYVQRNGQTPMTSFLTLFSGTPGFDQPYAAVHREYVDKHAFTRRYIYTVGNTIEPNTNDVFGIDDNGVRLTFFSDDDYTSINAVQRYIDVFRNGILQVFNQDYKLQNIELPLELQEILYPTIHFYSPLLSGTSIQINLGNVSATPSVLGVASLSANIGSGLRIQNLYSLPITTGDLSISAYPLDFVASVDQMRQPTRSDLMVSPTNLSAFPLLPKAYGHFRRTQDYIRTSSEDKYGSPTGVFQMIRGFNVGGLYSGLGTGETPLTLTCTLCPNLFNERSNTRNYSPKIELSVFNIDDRDDMAIPVVFNETKALTGFKFQTMTLFFEPPNNIDEVNITIY
jgi:hypothetical protein